MKNNRSKNTRSGRNNSTNSKLEKVYYVVIGILLLVLIGLVIFIFANRGNNTDQISENPTPGSEEIAGDSDEEEEQEDTEMDTEEEVTDETDLEDEEEPTDDEEDVEEDQEDTDTEEAENGDDDGEEEEETDDEEMEVADDVPLDESYVPDYSEGSTDRNAIAQAASSVTGISQGDMITWWVGNNGPGRVETTISDSSQNEVYTVQLQYGDGEWHVTNVEEESGVPN